MKNGWVDDKYRALEEEEIERRKKRGIGERRVEGWREMVSGACCTGRRV